MGVECSGRFEVITAVEYQLAVLDAGVAEEHAFGEVPSPIASLAVGEVIPRQRSWPAFDVRFQRGQLLRCQGVVVNPRIQHAPTEEASLACSVSVTQTYQQRRAGRERQGAGDVVGSIRHAVAIECAPVVREHQRHLDHVLAASVLRRPTALHRGRRRALESIAAWHPSPWHAFPKHECIELRGVRVLDGQHAAAALVKVCNSHPRNQCLVFDRLGVRTLCRANSDHVEQAVVGLKDLAITSFQEGMRFRFSEVDAVLAHRTLDTAVVAVVVGRRIEPVVLPVVEGHGTCAVPRFPLLGDGDRDGMVRPGLEIFGRSLPDLQPAVAAVPFGVHVAAEDQVEQAERFGVSIPIRNQIAGLAIMASGSKVLHRGTLVAKDGQFALTDAPRSSGQRDDLILRQWPVPDRHMIDQSLESGLEFAVLVPGPDQERQCPFARDADGILLVHQHAVDPQLEFRPGQSHHDVVPLGRTDQGDWEAGLHDGVEHILLKRVGPSFFSLQILDPAEASSVGLLGSPDEFHQ